jgi:hypothetical protein
MKFGFLLVAFALDAVPLLARAQSPGAGGLAVPATMQIQRPMGTVTEGLVVEPDAW